MLQFSNYGHIKRECPQKKKEERKRNSNNTDRAYAATSKLNDNIDVENVGLIVQEALLSISGGWIIDSCATSHLCNYRSMFGQMTTMEMVDVTPFRHPALVTYFSL